MFVAINVCIERVLYIKSHFGLAVLVHRKVPLPNTVVCIKTNTHRVQTRWIYYENVHNNAQ